MYLFTYQKSFNFIAVFNCYTLQAKAKGWPGLIWATWYKRKQWFD